MKKFNLYLTELSQGAINNAIKRFAKDGVDETEAKDTIELYNDLNQRNQLTVNIQTIKYDELKRLVDEKKNVKTKTQLKKQFHVIDEKGIKTVFKNDLVRVIIPLTHEMSCKYGVRAKWCTAVKDNPNHYKNYMERGVLYYLIPQKEGKDDVLSDDKMAIRFEDGELAEIRTLDNEKNHKEDFSKILAKFKIPAKIFNMYEMDDKYIVLKNISTRQLSSSIDLSPEIKDAFFGDKGIVAYEKNDIYEGLDYWKIDKENQKLLVKILDKENPKWHEGYKDVITALKDTGTQTHLTPAKIFLNKYPEIKKILTKTLNDFSNVATADEIIKHSLEYAKQKNIDINFDKEHKKFNIKINKNDIDVSDSDSTSDILKKIDKKYDSIFHFKSTKPLEQEFNKELNKELDKYWNSLVSDKDTPTLFKKVYKKKDK